jgi:glutamate N-acetyltransferase/amino-acid N-acetyltransferase
MADASKNEHDALAAPVPLGCMSVTTPKGFVAAGVASGIKTPSAPDLALVATDDGRAVPAAAVFTTNKAAAPPVRVSQAHLAATQGQAAAVILNSGNANAATGQAGHDHAEQMCRLTADGLGCRQTEVLVCSTGLIGIPLPIDTIVHGIPGLVERRAPDKGLEAAEAIMTTDTHPKQVVVKNVKSVKRVNSPGFTVGGMAKGAAMLAPNMATMLAVLTTDAVADPPILKRALSEAVRRSFNELSVDGATSTNDTVIVLASGRSNVLPDERDLTEALWEACADLAGQMAEDAEGGTKVVRIRVTGAATTDDARRGARKVAISQLAKCSWYGEDPYWGRIVSDLGSADIAFDLDKVRISYGGVAACVGGIQATVDDGALKKVMARPTIEIVADLGLGDGDATMLTTDLSHAYIDENMRTS